MREPGSAVGMAAVRGPFAGPQPANTAQTPIMRHTIDFHVHARNFLEYSLYVGGAETFITVPAPDVPILTQSPLGS